MHAHTIVRWFAVAGAASLLLTACSHGDKGGPKGDATPVTMESIMGIRHFDAADYGTMRQQVAEAIATCMIAQGWEYIPFTIPEKGPVDYTDDYADADEVARITREGLGITYSLLNDGASSDPMRDFVDPNLKYVTSLSKAEQIAYHDSLKGTTEELAATAATYVNPETGEEMQWNGIAGCEGKADDEVYQRGISSSPKYEEAMQGYYADLEQVDKSDPRIMKLNEDWSTCMKNAGFDYERPDDFWNKGQPALQARADEVLGSWASRNPMAGWSQDKVNEFNASATPDEINALYDQSDNLTADQRSQLEAIFADEVALGLADRRCSRDLYEKGPDVYAQIEAAYALEHQDELEALAATLANAE